MISSRHRSALAALLLVAPLSTMAADIALDASIDADPRVAGPGELTVMVRNTSDHALNLPAAPDWDAAGGLTIEVTNAAGSLTTLPVEAGAASEPDYVLAQGQSLGISRVLEGVAFATAGTYQVVVRYTGSGGVSAASAPIEVVVGD